MKSTLIEIKGSGDNNKLTDQVLHLGALSNSIHWPFYLTTPNSQFLQSLEFKLIFKEWHTHPTVPPSKQLTVHHRNHRSAASSDITLYPGARAGAWVRSTSGKLILAILVPIQFVQNRAKSIFGKLIQSLNLVFWWVFQDCLFRIETLLYKMSQKFFGLFPVI